MTFHVNMGKNHNINITFDYSPERVKKIKKVSNKWNPSGKYWELPFSEENIKRIITVLGDEELVFDPLLAFNVPELINSALKDTIWLKVLLEKTDGLLKLKGYSSHTISSYKGHIIRLFEFVKKEPNEIQRADIEEYLLDCLENKKVSFSYLNQGISAIKFLYKHIIRSNSLEYLNVPRPKKTEKLPDILSKEEVTLLLKEVKNLKHRAILMLTYSAGLRVSEVVSLKVMDIDPKRMLIHVRQGKGRKDRYSILSGNALNALRVYTKEIQPREWLFPGDQPEKHLTERTAQKVFESACKKTNIQKDVSIH